MSGADRLKEIRDRARAATAAQWTVDRNVPFSTEIVGIFNPITRTYIVQQDVSGDDETADGGMSEADAVFIANARDDIPWLLQQVANRDHVIGLLRRADTWDEISQILATWDAKEAAR